MSLKLKEDTYYRCVVITDVFEQLCFISSQLHTFTAVLHKSFGHRFSRQAFNTHFPPEQEKKKSENEFFLQRSFFCLRRLLEMNLNIIKGDSIKQIVPIVSRKFNLIVEMSKQSQSWRRWWLLGSDQ